MWEVEDKIGGEMDQFKAGDKVRWLCPYGYYIYGEITLIRDDEAKVIFGGGDWNYDYYRKSELELILPEHTREEDD